MLVVVKLTGNWRQANSFVCLSFCRTVYWHYFKITLQRGVQHGSILSTVLGACVRKYCQIFSFKITSHSICINSKGFKSNLLQMSEVLSMYIAISLSLPMRNAGCFSKQLQFKWWENSQKERNVDSKRSFKAETKVIRRRRQAKGEINHCRK